MTSIFKRIAFIGLIALLLSPFQNCSETQFSSIDAGDDPLSNVSGVGTPPDDDSESIDEETGEVIDDHVIDEAQKSCNEFKSNLLPMGLKTVTASLVENHRGSAIYSALELDIINHRGKILAPASKIVNVENQRGRVFARTEVSDAFLNIRGSLCLVKNDQDLAAQTNGVVKSIVNHRGRIELVGLDSDLIENSRGPIVIRGGHVKAIRNHRGSIRIIGGRLDLLEDHRGSIILEDGGVGPTTLINVR